MVGQGLCDRPWERWGGWPRTCWLQVQERADSEKKLPILPFIHPPYYK